VSVPPGPTLGPCTSWISGADVAACCVAAQSVDPDLLDAVAIEASMALYEISGRLFGGLCSRVARPQQTQCGCWPASSSGIPWFWSSGAASFGWGGWGWYNENGDHVGCQPMSVVRLAGYPVRAITAVKIDGAVLPALDANGNPNYRLDGYRNLVRMADPGPPYSQRFWPSCQNMDLDDTQPGTFSVSYQWGVDPPQLGRDAAAALACQLWASCSGSGQDCAIPAGVTRLVREGVQIDRQLLANWFDPTKGTGIVPVDMFLRAYAGKNAPSRRSAVWSPDVQGFARSVGTTPSPS
jgi:hypothetical protein